MKVLVFFVLAATMVAGSDDSRWISLSKQEASPATLSDGPEAHPPPGGRDAILWCGDSAAAAAVYLYIEGRLWKYEEAPNRWFIVDAEPAPGAAPTMAWNDDKGRFWLYDGDGGVWSYEVAQRAWTKHDGGGGGPAGASHGHWYDHERALAYMVADDSSVWQLRVDTFNWTRVRTSGAPLDASVAYGRGSRKVYLHGGDGALHSFDLDTLAWAEVPHVGESFPSARTGHLLWLDAGQDHLLLYGDEGLWSMELETSEWTPPASRRDKNGPRDRSHSAQCQADSDGALYIFGGDGDPPFNDVWKYGTYSLFGTGGLLDVNALKSDRALAAASLAAAMSTLVFFLALCYALYSLLSHCRRRKDQFDRHHDEEIQF